MNIAEAPAKFLAADLLARFVAIVGDKNAITDREAQAPYLTEPRDMFRGSSPVVLRPGSVAEVAEILKLANETTTAIVPQGGNTGLVGGQIPQHGEIVLSLNRLDRVREVDPVSNTMTCEAGVTLLRAREAAAEVDRLYPQLLPSEGSCTIGGNLSTNAGGTAALAYGIARSHALGIEVVLRDGAGCRDLLPQPHPWYVLIELSSQARSGLRAVLEEILAEGLERRLVQDATIAESLDQTKMFWRVREMFGEVQRHEGGSIKHDVSVPVAAVPAFIAEANAAVAKLVPAARPLPFGHLGDGNIHYNVAQPVGADKTEFLGHWSEINAAVFAVVAKYGGSISAEHGIGVMKRDLLPKVKDPVAYGLMRTLKLALDPKGILNPGKVLQPLGRA